MLGVQAGSSCRSFTLRNAIPLRPKFVQSYSSFSVASAPTLPSWDIETFRQRAFQPSIPHCLPRSSTKTFPASSKWFIHDDDQSFDLHDSSKLPKASELRSLFWREHAELSVPLELSFRGESGHSQRFERNMVPLRFLLDHMAESKTSSTGKMPAPEVSLYLAQCSLASLPESIREDVPAPDLINVGKGDIYDSSLWLGRAPTYTPLHRDPNPNLFVQLAGQKVVRLLPPEIGQMVFERVQEEIKGNSNASLRGTEMMEGQDREVLEAGVWGAEDEKSSSPAVTEISSAMKMYAMEAKLALGEGLFIPKGWWHSVKGVGSGVTASLNWWFR